MQVTREIIQPITEECFYQSSKRIFVGSCGSSWLTPLPNRNRIQNKQGLCQFYIGTVFHVKGPIVTSKQRQLLYLALILLKSQETCAAFKDWKIINFQPTRLDQDLVDEEINGTLTMAMPMLCLWAAFVHVISPSVERFESKSCKCVNVTDEISAEYGVKMDRRDIIYSFIHCFYTSIYGFACRLEMIIVVQSNSTSSGRAVSIRYVDNT